MLRFKLQNSTKLRVISMVQEFSVSHQHTVFDSAQGFFSVVMSRNVSVQRRCYCWQVSREIMRFVLYMTPAWLARGDTNTPGRHQLDLITLERDMLSAFCWNKKGLDVACALQKHPSPLNYLRRLLHPHHPHHHPDQSLALNIVAPAAA